MDKRIKSYTKKNGTKSWMFKTYLGIDPVTGKKRATTKRGFSSKGEAEIALIRCLNDVNTNGFNHNKINSYYELYTLWLETYENSVKPSTLLKTQRLFKNHILPAFGNMKLTDITIVYCQQVLNDWVKKLVRAKTVMNYTGLPLKYAVKMDLLSKNPAQFVTMPAKNAHPNDKPDNYYDKNELAVFFRALNSGTNEQAKVFFRLLAYSGLRRGEALALTWDDVSFTRSTIEINKTLSRDSSGVVIQTPKTTNGYRTLVLDSETMLILKKWQVQQLERQLFFGFNIKGKPKQLLFANTRNNSFISTDKPRVWLQQVYKHYSTLKHITVHGFRHTHASLYLESGASIKDLQMRLGHSDIRTTMDVYAHVAKYTKKASMDKFAKYLDI